MTRGIIDLTSRPKLAGFTRLEHDGARGRWVVQAPERVFVLDDISREILGRCDGNATVEEIVAALSSEYDAPRETIEHDVLAVLNVLAEKTFVVNVDEPGESR